MATAKKVIDPWSSFLQGLSDDPHTRRFKDFAADRWLVEAQINITGRSIADVIAEMARLRIPLSAEVTADIEYYENGPESFLKWYIPADELPSPSRRRGV